ncbi:uncharacterized protein N7484_005296 [Penicillium longicatenatum]|uniref:uncharacterized protein n=1 Tax=Penicillium longicatenatum TaxID=1561947 RepID=UPI00254741E2|nr:uncharacterized protein N7484_005296 [Penicillium longicatenatum]KAJ5651573.1 hypothetical protein N7484_005296 [Penicillium longicatenatum]
MDFIFNVTISASNGITHDLKSSVTLYYLLSSSRGPYSFYIAFAFREAQKPISLNTTTRLLTIIINVYAS